MYSQGNHVLTKWSTKSVGARVLIPAPTQRPVTPVTITVSMDASAPQVQQRNTQICMQLHTHNVL